MVILMQMQCRKYRDALPIQLIPVQTKQVLMLWNAVVGSLLILSRIIDVPSTPSTSINSPRHFQGSLSRLLPFSSVLSFPFDIHPSGFSFASFPSFLLFLTPWASSIFLAPRAFFFFQPQAEFAFRYSSSLNLGFQYPGHIHYGSLERRISSRILPRSKNPLRVNSVVVLPLEFWYLHNIMGYRWLSPL